MSKKPPTRLPCIIILFGKHASSKRLCGDPKRRFNYQLNWTKTALTHAKIDPDTWETIAAEDHPRRGLKLSSPTDNTKRIYNVLSVDPDSLSHNHHQHSSVTPGQDTSWVGCAFAVTPLTVTKGEKGNKEREWSPRSRDAISYRRRLYPIKYITIDLCRMWYTPRYIGNHNPNLIFPIFPR